MLFTGIAKDKEGGEMLTDKGKGPNPCLQLAAVDGSFEARDFVTFNAKNAWKLRIINKAVGLPASNLKSLLQARDSEITDTFFPEDLMRAVLRSWEGKRAWVTLDYGRGYKYPDVTWEVTKPAVVGANAAAEPKQSSDTASPFTA
jgi:hypothetical protein